MSPKLVPALKLTLFAFTDSARCFSHFMLFLPCSYGWRYGVTAELRPLLTEWHAKPICGDHNRTVIASKSNGIGLKG